MRRPSEERSATTLSRALVLERTWPFFLDLSVAPRAAGRFYAILWIAQFWFSGAIPEVDIYRSPSHAAAVRFLFRWSASSLRICSV